MGRVVAPILITLYIYHLAVVNGDNRNKLIISNLFWPPRTPSSLLTSLDAISSKFENIYIATGNLAAMVDILDKLDPKTRLHQPLNANVYMRRFDELNATLAMSEKLQLRNIHLHSLDIWRGIPKDKPSWFDNLVGNISTMCTATKDSFKQPNNAMQKVGQSCGFFSDRTGSLILPLELSVETNSTYDFHENFKSYVLPALNASLVARSQVLQNKLKEHVLLKIGYIDESSLPKKDSGCYCNEQLLKLNSYHESIVNWAEIHKFPVIFPFMFPEFNYNNNCPTWWTRLEVSKEISQQVVSTMPIYVLRNFPGGFENPSWIVDKCVKWSEHVPQDGILFDKDMSGITVSMDVGKDFLTVCDIETMLYFSLHRSETVELITKKDKHQLKDLQTLNYLLETDFLEALHDFDIKGGRLFLQISVEDTRFTEIFQEVETLAEKISRGTSSELELTGVHFTHWQDHTSPETVVQQVVALGQKLNFQVGLVVDNCYQLLNELVASKNLTSIPASDFVLCPTKNIPGYNKNKEDLSNYLDTNLYVSKMFKKFLPGRTVYFRVNSFPCCEGDDEEKQRENLFRFLSDVNQFAVGIQVRHFLVQAFTTTKESFSRSSWFRVKNTDFCNASAIIDKEESFTNKSISSHSLLMMKILKRKFKLRDQTSMATSTIPPSTTTPSLHTSMVLPPSSTLPPLTSNPSPSTSTRPFMNLNIWGFISIAVLIIVAIVLFTAVFLFRRQKWTLCTSQGTGETEPTSSLWLDSVHFRRSSDNEE